MPAGVQILLNHSSFFRYNLEERRVVGTCIQFPPVNVFEEWVSSDFITTAVLEPHPFVHISRQQPVAQRPGVLAEVVLVSHLPSQHALLHLFTLDLRERQRSSHALAVRSESASMAAPGLTPNLLASVPKRVLGRHEFIQSDAQSEVVHRGVILVTFQHLWSHVPCKSCAKIQLLSMSVCESGSR